MIANTNTRDACRMYIYNIYTVEDGPKTEAKRVEFEGSLGPNSSLVKDEEEEEEPTTCFAFSIW